MAGAHRSAPLASAEYLIPAGVTCVLSVWEAADTQLLSCSHLVRVVPTEFSVSDRCWQGSLNPTVCSPAPHSQGWPIGAGVALPVRVAAHPQAGFSVSPLSRSTAGAGLASTSAWTCW